MANNPNVLTAQAQQVPQPVIQQVTPLVIPSHTIQPRHPKANYFMVKVGLAADRPADGTATRFYFANDTFVMSYYDTDTKAWKSSSAFS